MRRKPAWLAGSWNPNAENHYPAWKVVQVFRLQGLDQTIPARKIMPAAKIDRAPTAAIQALTAAFVQPDGVHFISI
ncbi:hypothetical protein EBB79_23430 (plasmid) [Parasedimentitalea marina]|uniref:Uncharacterized protein n=1 Tax=Parasedimentitalea marina TaxID=2483033 RepID=A0A3T0NA36_9RHOB|nr:hypothetical protein EBB79_23430 [Parasedimentitalea marina]